MAIFAVAVFYVLECFSIIFFLSTTRYVSAPRNDGRDFRATALTATRTKTIPNLQIAYLNIFSRRKNTVRERERQRELNIWPRLPHQGKYAV